MATLPPGRRGDQHLASGEQLPARPPAHDSARALSLGVTLSQALSLRRATWSPQLSGRSSWPLLPRGGLQGQHGPHQAARQPAGTSRLAAPQRAPAARRLAEPGAERAEAV